MTFTFPLPLVAIPICVALTTGALGWHLARKGFPTRPSVVCILISVLAAGIFAPSMAVDRVDLSEDALTQHTGFWFAQTVKGFTYAEVASIRITTAKDRKDRDYELWILTNHNGQTRSIDPGDLWALNTDQIVPYLRSKGLQIDQD